ncbi:DUF2637 domain-containing protein [Actinomadura keratinilytica]
MAGAVVIAAIGFAGSYTAVRELALDKGFGTFSYFFPIGIDAGICVLLALDLLLTWMRIPFPMLRQTAWLLTAATIAFNGAAAWPDPLGVGMHAVIPVLFVVAVEAARHAIGRIADITADKHMEGVRITRWLLSPLPTFLLWRRMKLWELRSYEQVIKLEQERLVYQARLRSRFGRSWRRKAPVESLMPLRLARYGVPLAETAPAASPPPASNRPSFPRPPPPPARNWSAPTGRPRRRPRPRRPPPWRSSPRSARPRRRRRSSRRPRRRAARGSPGSRARCSTRARTTRSTSRTRRPSRSTSGTSGSPRTRPRWPRRRRRRRRPRPSSRPPRRSGGTACRFRRARAEPVRSAAPRRSRPSARAAARRGRGVGAVAAHASGGRGPAGPRRGRDRRGDLLRGLPAVRGGQRELPERPQVRPVPPGPPPGQQRGRWPASRGRPLAVPARVPPPLRAGAGPGRSRARLHQRLTARRTLHTAKAASPVLGEAAFAVRTPQSGQAPKRRRTWSSPTASSRVGRRGPVSRPTRSW